MHVLISSNEKLQYTCTTIPKRNKRPNYVLNFGVSVIELREKGRQRKRWDFNPFFFFAKIMFYLNCSLLM